MKFSISTRFKGYFYIFIGIFFWSTIEIILKLIQSELNSLQTNFWRLFIGGSILSFISIKRSKIKYFYIYLKKYFKYYIYAAIIGMVLGQLIYIQGTQLTNSAYAATIFSSNPIIISIYAIIYFKEKKYFKKFVGIFLGFFSIFIIITEFKFKENFKFEFIIGNILVFIGMCFWCVDVILGKKIAILSNLEYKNSKITQNHSLFFNSITFIISSLLMTPFMIYKGYFISMKNYSVSTWIYLIYLGAITGSLSYFLFFHGLNLIEASEGINVFYFKPIFATILSYIIFPNIVLNFYFYIGLILELFSLYLISTKSKIASTRR